MTQHPPKLIVLLPLGITVPEIPDPTPKTFLAGAALLTVVRDDSGRFSFDLATCSIGAGVSEAILIDWLLGRLPDEAVVLGYKLAEEALPALIEGSASAEPELALDFLNRLTRLVTFGHLDAAAELGGAGAPRLDEGCRTNGIPAEDISHERLLTIWSLGGLGCLDDVLAADVISLWRLWLQTALPDEVQRARAEAELCCWLSSRPDALGQAHRSEP